MTVVVSARTMKSVVHPWVDTAFIGGLSLFFFVPMLLLPNDIEKERFDEPLLVLTALINSPHILASCWLLYRSKKGLREHPIAAFVVPVVLFALCAGSIVLRYLGVFPGASDALLLVMVLYTPLHFVNQAWGMMSVYSFLDGAPFQDDERKPLRAGLSVLIGWVMLWALAHHNGWPASLTTLSSSIYGYSIPLLPVGFVLGLVGLLRYRRRVGYVPLRVWVPWLAIFVWYASAARHPSIHPFIQMAHALQYVIFPLRVEMNTTSDGTPVSAMSTTTSSTPSLPEGADPWPTALSFFLGGAVLCFGLPQWFSHGAVPLWVHPVPAISFGAATLCLLALRGVRAWRPTTTIALQRALALASTTIVLGCVSYWFIHRATKLGLGSVGIDGDAIGVSVAVAAFFNIHHYFTDGVLWKMRNPDVRRALFLHLRS